MASLPLQPFRISFPLALSLALLALGPGCTKGSPAEQPFEANPQAVTVTPTIEEVSGIADSQVNPGQLWAHEDSGNPAHLYLINRQGAVTGTIPIKGLVNRDWEEMAIAGTDLYIAETGDNNHQYPEYAIYRFAEPLSTVDSVRSVSTIRFRYPDGAHDTEAMLVDEVSRDIFLVTKRDSVSRIYRLASPYSTTALNTVTLEGTLPYTGVVGAALSANGSEIIIKTYQALHYYRRNTGESIRTALTRGPLMLPYQAEPQGEAVTFASDNGGFFTLSEKAFGSQVQLNFYRRK